MQACSVTNRIQAGRFERSASFEQRLTRIAAQSAIRMYEPTWRRTSREDKRPSVSQVNAAGKPIHRRRHEVACSYDEKRGVGGA
jgi:hypothetical protein